LPGTTASGLARGDQLVTTTTALLPDMTASPSPLIVIERLQMLPDLHRASAEPILRNLLDAWIEQTSWHSSITSMTRHPLFAEIVSMGSDVTKYILERMQSGDIRLHWFPVLQDTVKIDPVPPYSRGNLPEMAAAWIDWGRANRVL
jgi:hypothetical protein